MRWTKALLMVWLLAPAGAAQQLPAPPAASPPSELCSIAGVVVKATTGEAVRKIVVTLFPLQAPANSYASNNPLTATTDSGGRFEFTTLQPGRYTLSAGGNGYPQQIYGQTHRHQSGKVVTLAPGASQRSLVFRLTPPGVITGTIRDEDGDPVVGGQVRAFRMTNMGGRPQASAGGFAQTNDLGEYRIYGLDPGQYFIGANYQRPIAGNTPAQDVYLPTYYPSTADTGQAAAIQVTAGDEVSGIDVDLAAARSATVRGRVVTEVPVKNLKGTYVSLLPRSIFAGFMGGSFGGIVQDDAGNFEIRGVPPGTYVVSAFVNDGANSYSGRAWVDTADAAVDGILVSVGPGITLHGTLHLLGGAELDLRRLSVSLQPIEPNLGGNFAPVAANGTFAVENLFAGTYRVNVAGFPEEYYLQAVRQGGADVLSSGLNVSSSGSPNDIEIVLSHEGGRVDGVVRDGQQPAHGATVVIVPDPPNRDRTDLYSFKTTDGLGRFSLLGLPPGDFKLFAFEPRDGVSFTDPDFIKDFDDRGTPVHIQDKTQQSVQLILIPTDSADDE